MRLTSTLTLFLSLLLLGSGLTLASERAATPHVQAQLLTASDVVTPGQTLRIGVQQKIIPHWHTYWQNPGDSGLATRIDWRLPTGSKATPLEWPTPQRFKLGTVTNFGYADEVTLLSTLEVPISLKPGARFPIHAKVSWLVCEEVCIPEEVELSLELPVVSASGQTSTPAAIKQAEARLPMASPWSSSYRSGTSLLELSVASTGLKAERIADVWFYPSQWGKVTHNAAQPWRVQADGLHLQLTPGEAPPAAGEPLEGVLVITERSDDGLLSRGFTLRAEAVAGVPAPMNEDNSIDFFSALGLALLGGLILNLMPCVFPVLSIKALSLLQQGQHNRLQNSLHGLAYTAGILLSFLLLGLLLLLLRRGGAEIGWGFQFQSPGFVLSIAYLMFAVGLSLSGVLTLGSSVAGIGGNLAGRAGYVGSFFTGVLATIVATPCTAPFMGAAIAYALAQPAPALMAIFTSLGLGLALPYLLLSHWPQLQRYLPKPGVWMERLKQLFAFPMYATALWLLWVLAQQAGNSSVILALGGMLLMALAGRLHAQGWSKAAVVVLLIIAGGSYWGLKANTALTPSSHAEASITDPNQPWQPYSEKRLQALRAEGKPVFLNFTAAWCITCLANERVALSKPQVLDAFKQDGITYLKGDWTNQDEAITRKLAEFKRNGVPLYVFYPAGPHSQPIVLPQLLTPELVLDHIRPHP